MTDWKMEGTPRMVAGSAGSAMVQYLRGAGGVGGHDVYLGTGETVRMLPDSTTTARRRTGAVQAAVEGNVSLLAQLVGALVVSGATNVLVDGKPIMPNTGGRWIVELADGGEVSMRYVEGATDDQGARELSEGAAT